MLLETYVTFLLFGIFCPPPLLSLLKVLLRTKIYQIYLVLFVPNSKNHACNNVPLLTQRLGKLGNGCQLGRLGKYFELLCFVIPKDNQQFYLLFCKYRKCVVPSFVSFVKQSS